MSVDRKLQAHTYHLRPRRKSAGNVVQTITVHDGHLAANSCQSSSTSSPDMDRLPSKCVHPANGRLAHSDASHGHGTTLKCDNGHAFGCEDVFMELPTVNRDGSRPVAIEEELQAQVHQLNGLLSAWKKRCQEQKQQNAALVQQLHSAQTECASVVEHTKEKYHKQLYNIRTELNRVNAMKDKLENEYSDMQKSFRKSLEQNKNDMEALHLKWKQRSSDIEKLRGLNVQSCNEISKLQNLLDQLRFENRKLTHKAEKLSTELDKIRTDHEKKNNNTTCACMGQEYRLLFELALSKIKTFESEHAIKSQNIKHDFHGGNDALFQVQKNLENIAQTKLTETPDLRHMAERKTTDSPVQYLSDSVDSCDSPRSLPRSPELHSKKRNEDKPAHTTQRKLSVPARTSRKHSSFSITDIGSALVTSGFGSLSNINNGHVTHVTHPLDMQTPRDQYNLVRPRAFSERKQGAKRHPFKKSYTTEDSRIVDAIGQNPVSNSDQSDPFDSNTETKDVENHTNKGDTANIVRCKATDVINNSVIAVEICSDNDPESDNDRLAEKTKSPGSTSGFGGLRSRRNGIAGMPLDVSVQLRMNDVKKSKEFSDLLKKFTKDKDATTEKKFSAIRKLSRKKSKPSVKD